MGFHGRWLWEVGGGGREGRLTHWGEEGADLVALRSTMVDEEDDKVRLEDEVEAISLILTVYVYYTTILRLSHAYIWGMRRLFNLLQLFGFGFFIILMIWIMCFLIFRGLLLLLLLLSRGCMCVKWMW